MDYFSKYLKYKHKYNNLKSQFGGTSFDLSIQELTLTDLHQVRIQANQYLSQIIPTDKFINPEEIARLIDENGLDEIIDNVIINYIYKQDENKILNVYTNPDNFFNKLYQVVLATNNIWIHLKKYTDTNDHTVLLIPGDSPTYFLFLLKTLYPEISTNPKVTIVEFPISKLGSFKENFIEFTYSKNGTPADYKINVDGKPYLKFIIDNNVPESIREIPHQFVIIDYLEAGKSAVFIEHTIKELYDTQPYRINKNFVKVINLAYYFQTTSEIQENLSEYDKFIEKYNKKIKSKPNKFDGLAGAIKYEKFLFANWYFYLDNNFLEGLKDFAKVDSIKVLKYLVDDSDRRCQHKICLYEATELAASSTSMSEFISKISKPYNIHIQCNLFNILLYLICNHYAKMNSKCGELVKTISDKIISLIQAMPCGSSFARDAPLNTPVKIIVNGNEKLGQIIGYEQLKAQFKNLEDKIELIGLLDIKSINTI